MAEALGAIFAKRFTAARQQLGRAPVEGARDLPKISGLNPNGTASVPVENIYAKATKILSDSGKVYRYGDSLMLETGTDQSPSLEHLTTGCESLPTAHALLANHLTCESVDGNKLVYFAATAEFCQHALGTRTHTGNIASDHHVCPQARV